MNEVVERSTRFEHRFWLQILGDHSRFIFESLAPIQKDEIEQASNFINIFDTLLERSKSSPLTQLTVQVEPEVLKLRDFKFKKTPYWKNQNSPFTYIHKSYGK